MHFSMVKTQGWRRNKKTNHMILMWESKQTNKRKESPIPRWMREAAGSPKKGKRSDLGERLGGKRREFFGSYGI